MPNQLHLWYSEKSVKSGHSTIKYILEDGSIVDICFATPGKKHTILWDDLVYLGVGQYFGNGNSTNQFIPLTKSNPYDEFGSKPTDEILNDFQNLLYALICYYSEGMEGSKRFVGNGHHFAQKASSEVIESFKERIIEKTDKV